MKICEMMIGKKRRDEKEVGLGIKPKTSHIQAVGLSLSENYTADQFK